jgi:hypothetical protein
VADSDREPGHSLLATRCFCAIRKFLINLIALSAQGADLRPKSNAMRIVDLAVRSYLAVVAAGYVVLCSALLSLVLH